MTEFIPKTTVILLASNNPAVVEATQQVLEVHESIHLLNRSIVPSLLYQVIAEIHPDIILVDFDSQRQPYYLVNKITRDYPVCKVIAVLPPSKATHANRAVQAGVHAAVHYPYESDHMEGTIMNILDSLGKSQVQPSNSPEISAINNHTYTYTVFSPKGGSGTSTIATNLAISLHKALREDLLLIDGKLLFGHVDLYLNILTGNSITDLITHAGMLDQQLVKQVVVKHKSGIDVLPGPISTAEAQKIRPEGLFKVIQFLQEMYPIIIVDCGNNLNENIVTYMDASDQILLVLNPDLASIRDTRQFLEISSSLGYELDKILLVLNLADRKMAMKGNEIEEILNMKIFARIPSDENIALSCLNEGVPILIKKPRHPISKSIAGLTKDLVKIIQTQSRK